MLWLYLWAWDLFKDKWLGLAFPLLATIGGSYSVILLVVEQAEILFCDFFFKWGNKEVDTNQSPDPKQSTGFYSLAFVSASSHTLSDSKEVIIFAFSQAQIVCVCVFVCVCVYVW